MKSQSNLSPQRFDKLKFMLMDNMSYSKDITNGMCVCVCVHVCVCVCVHVCVCVCVLFVLKKQQTKLVHLI